MKILCAAGVLAVCVPSSIAFGSASPKRNYAASTNVQMKLRNDDDHRDDRKNNWLFTPLIATAVGLTFATQVAGASMIVPAVVDDSPSIPVSVQHTNMATTEVKSEIFSGSSLQIAANNQDFLDFSLPSYGDSVGSSSSTNKKDAPTFNSPFKNFDFSAPKVDTTDETSSSIPILADEKESEEQLNKAEAKAAADAAKQQRKEEEARVREEKIIADKEAAAQKRAEKEAAEAAKQQRKEEEARVREEKRIADEEAAAQKRAEKETRKEMEKEKQRLAVERANSEKEEKAAAAAAARNDVDEEEVSKSDGPSFSLPDVKIPEFKAPSLGGLTIPDIKTPEYSLDVPEFKGSDVKLPEVSLPKLSIPKIDIPKVELKVPNQDPSAPSFSVPSSNVELPKISVPSFSAPSFTSSSDTGSGEIAFDGDSQQLLDERAKTARSDFNEADSTAKEYEKKAKQFRDIANDKKRIAKDAKDEACRTRFGGKTLCIRPFGIGY